MMTPVNIPVGIASNNNHGRYDTIAVLENIMIAANICPMLCAAEHNTDTPINEMCFLLYSGADSINIKYDNTAPASENVNDVTLPNRIDINTTRSTDITALSILLIRQNIYITIKFASPSFNPGIGNNIGIKLSMYDNINATDNSNASIVNRLACDTI